MATLQELQNIHEELIEVCGNFVTTVGEINGDEPKAVLAEMVLFANVARKAMLGVVAKIDELMELKREAE